MKRQAGDMLAKLPGDYIPHEVRERLKKMGAIAPMNIFLRQEIDRMQRVITLIRTTLQDLQLAIEGTIIMSEVSLCHREINSCLMLVRALQNLRDALDSIYDAKVPKTWGKVWPHIAHNYRQTDDIDIY